MEPGWQSGVLTLYCALLPSHQTHTSPPRDQHVLKKTRTLLPSLGDLSELALQGGG